MSDDEVIALVREHGGVVQHFPMVAIQSIAAVARGEHPTISTDVTWVPLREGAEKLLSRASLLRDIDPLKSPTTSG
jgi:hypothetical protein